MNSIRNFSITLASLLACASCQDPAPHPTASSITVYPVLLAGSANADVANVVGSLLERGGMPDVQVAETAFTADAQQDFAGRAAAFATFAQKAKLPTERALFVDIQGNRQAGITRLQSVLVDGQGKVMWSEQHAAGEPTFAKAQLKEPLDCCIFVAQRLREPLGLADPLRSDAKEGKLGARMKNQAGVPTPAEQQAMAARHEALRKLGADAPIRVLPPRIGKDWSPMAATDLAKRLGAAGLTKVTAAAETVRFETKASSNEQAVLWSGARSLQQALRAAPAGSDYVLATDFLMAGEGKVGAVHCYLLAQNGDFVWVDYQNSHHDDFRAIEPKTAADCVALAAKRVQQALGR